MKTKTVKTEQEVIDAILSGDTTDPKELFEVTFKDGTTITRIRIGNLIVDSIYGFTVTRIVDREEAKRYRLIATVQGFPPQVSYHDDYAEFADAQTKFDHNATLDTNDGKQIAVMIGADGSVVEDNNVAVGVDDDLTF